MDDEKPEEEARDAVAEPDAGEPTAGEERSLSEAELKLLEEIKQEGWDESTYFNRLFAMQELEEQKRGVVVKQALGKFNFFLHLTAFISGLAYLLLLGILYRPALPWVFIPIGLWFIGISYHFYRAFFKAPKPDAVEKPKRQKKTSKPLGWIDEDPQPASADDAPDEVDKNSGG
jgi:hypothetical protein